MQKVMNNTNSSLIDYQKISPNRTSPRSHKIDTITIHCMAGNLSVESCGNLFAKPGRQASSNYGIGSDGRIALYVEEKDRSWCSSNAANDNRAVTIEVANDGGAPDWHVSEKAMASLIELAADICRRNDIKELKWKADKSLIGRTELQNMTVHRWFSAKSCPGNYLYGRHAYIAEEVNKKLGISPAENNNGGIYQVRLLDDLNIRKTPNGKILQVNGAKKGFIYTIVKTEGAWGFLKSGAGWISVSDKYVKRV